MSAGLKCVNGTLFFLFDARILRARARIFLLGLIHRCGITVSRRLRESCARIRRARLGMRETCRHRDHRGRQYCSFDFHRRASLDLREFLQTKFQLLFHRNVPAVPRIPWRVF